MTVSMFIRHKVNDYARWKEHYLSAAPKQKKLGVIADSIHRDPDDPNMVIIYQQYKDESTAKAALAAMDTEEMREFVKSATGFIWPGDFEIWLGEDIE